MSDTMKRDGQRKSAQSESDVWKGLAAGVAGAVYRKLSSERYFAIATTAGGTKDPLPEIVTTYPGAR